MSVSNSSGAPGAAPYSGPAPAPSRSISIGSAEPEATNVGFGTMDQTYDVDPSTLTPGIDPHQPLRSPSPHDPGLASQVAELNGRVGELIQALGEKDAAHRRDLDDMQFRMNVQLAAMSGSGSGAVRLPDGIDPDQPVKAGELASILSTMGTLSQARTVRDIVGITPQEEATVLSQIPALANVPEPRKTELLKEAVLRQRGLATAPASNPASAPSATPPSTRLATRTPAGRTVPHVESSQRLANDEPTQSNPYQDAMRAYYEADKIPDKTQRLAAKKSAMKRAQAALGISETAMSKSDWSQGVPVQ